MDEKFAKVGENLLPAIAYGDAAGLPYEKQPAHDTYSVRGLIDIRTNPFIGPYTAGTWSDDTQLSLAVSESLIRSGGFNLDDLATAHIKAHYHTKGRATLGESIDMNWIPPIITNNTQNGWGRSTTRSVERLIRGLSPRESGEPGGAGNGVLMKMAPLVYWQEATRTPRMKANSQVVELTRMTHDSPEAIVSSQTHRYMLKRLLHLRVDSERPISELLLSRIPKYGSILLAVASAAEHYENQLGSDPETSSRLYELVRMTKNLKYFNRRAIIEGAPKGGFYAPETLFMAYGSLVLQSRFPDSVFRAVEMGGDSDSVGSIVGAMSACLYDELKKPTDYYKLYAVERLEQTSKRLADTALKYTGKE